MVDVLNGFCKQGNLASPRCDAAIPRIGEVIEERRRAGDQLIFLADTHDPNDREFEVFRMMGKGVGPKEIAARLGLSVKTIETYQDHLKRKLGAANGRELLRLAMEHCV